MTTLITQNQKDEHAFSMIQYTANYEQMIRVECKKNIYRERVSEQWKSVIFSTMFQEQGGHYFVETHFVCKNIHLFVHRDE